VAAACASYWLYLLECEGGSYYAGIALDVEQRFFMHVIGRGARYTRSHPPLRVLAAALYDSKGEALKAEYRLKQLPRADKLGFFAPAAASPSRRLALVAR
jgi:putative endonuclease